MAVDFPPRRLTVVILTATRRRPERAPLLERAVRAAAAQRVSSATALEVLVLDDGPDAAGWPYVRAAVCGVERARLCGADGAVAEGHVAVRYVAVPPDASGRVCLRLKRNLALELCSVSGTDAILFCDDDDWRSADAAQAQLDALARTGADACSVQVRCVCELSASRGGASYFEMPAAGGGGVFSAELGNPGTALLLRRTWAPGSDDPPGFPDTPYEARRLARASLAVGGRGSAALRAGAEPA